MALIRTDLEALYAGTTVTYNGYEIPPDGLHAHASVTAVYDNARKTKLYDKVMFTADFVVALEGELGVGASSVDQLVSQLRKILMTPKQPLRIRGHGFGEYGIKIGTSDTDNGPFPLDFRVEQLHSSKVIHIVWTIEFNLTGCAVEGFLSAGDLSSFNFSVEWGWSDLQAGLRTRNITGSATMFTFTSANTLFSSQRKARELIEQSFPRINAGYHREYRFTLSDDRKTLLFSITETEIMSDTPFPEAIADLSMRQSLRGSRKNAFFSQWNWSIAASVAVFIGRTAGTSIAINKRFAWIAVTRMILDRILKAKDRVYYVSETERKVTVFIDDISINDEITGNTFDLTISGLIWVTSNQLFQSTGMFQPLGGTTTTWAQRNNFLKQLGIDAFQLKSDAPAGIGQEREPIISLCNTVGGTTETSSQEYKPAAPETMLVESEKPKPEESWYKYEYHVRLLDYNTSVLNVPLSDELPREDKLRNDPAVDSSEQSPISDPLDSGITADNALTPIVTVHNPTTRVYKVVLTGKALRQGYRINTPNLISYGGMKAVKIGQDEIVERTSPPRVDVNNQELREHYVAWRKYYVLVVPKPGEKISKDNPNVPQHDRYLTDVPKQFKNRK